MTQPFFNISVSVDDRTGRMLAVYFRIRKGDVAETDEVEEGRAFADYDPDGLLLGVELLAPCKVELLDRLTERESDPVKRFFKQSAPREMVLV